MKLFQRIIIGLLILFSTTISYTQTFIVDGIVGLEFVNTTDDLNDQEIIAPFTVEVMTV